MGGSVSMTKETQEELTLKMRRYLARIHQLADFSGSAGFISTAELAETFLVTAPAVNRMVNRLRELGLIEHAPYKGIRLTEQGRTEALKYLRQHRIIECFLVEVLKVPWTEAHEEATSMSSINLSEALIDRMFEMAGRPQFCPHGEPIPNKAGELPTLEDISLSETQKGQKVVVTRLRTRDKDRLQYIGALGILPNTLLTIHSVAPFNGPLQIRLNTHTYRIVGHNLAELIRVRVLENEQA